MDKFDTHKFLYTLFYEGKIKGHSVVYIDRNNKEQIIEIEGIEIGASPISCRIFDKHGKKHNVMFVRIKEVFLEGVRVWENTDFNIDDFKIIKGYE